MPALSIAAALQTILDSVSHLDPIECALEDSLGMVLADPVVARDDAPFTDNSAMDGFAVRTSDLEQASSYSPVKLKLGAEMIAAGGRVGRVLSAGGALRIMTGAVIPEGCDAIVPVEHVSIEGEYAVFTEKCEPGAHIRRQGEDMRAGSVVLARGAELTPAAFGVAAAAGCGTVTVFRRPRVAVLTCGDEIIPYDEPMTAGKVRNSNAVVLHALLGVNNVVPIDLGTAADDRLDLAERIDSARGADALIIAGGVSMGERDLVKNVLDQLGFKMKFWKVDVKPGRPLLFGMLDSKPVFGLPGNPVSTQVAFEIFVRPALMKMMGRKNVYRPVRSAAVMSEIKRSPGRPELMRVALTHTEDGLSAEPTRAYQGSGITTSMPAADGLLFVESDTVFVPKGEKLPCVILREEECESFVLSARGATSQK